MIHTFNFPGFSFKMDLDISFPADKHFILQGVNYEADITHVLLRTLKPGDHAVDAGANVGYFSMLMAALVGSKGRVMSYDPVPTNQRKLIANRDLNAFAQIDMDGQPLWSKEGEQVTFHTNVDDTGGSALWDPGLWVENEQTRHHPDTFLVTTTTLDASANISHKTKLMKLDVEGAEQQVLEGASRILAYYYPPYIICELNPFALCQMKSSQKDLRAYMAIRGYETFLLYRDGSMPKLVPYNTEIVPRHILNILFSTLAAVAEAWPEEAHG